MKKNLLILGLLTLIILSGCVTANITANKAEWYNKKLTRVYVLLNSAKEAEKFSNELAKGIMTEFRNNNVEGKYQIRNPLSLETEKDLENRINEYKPNQLMIFKQTSLHSTNGLIDGGVFEISIIEGETKKIVWKGVLDVYGQFGMETSIKQSLMKLSEKLKQDGLM